MIVSAIVSEIISETGGDTSDTGLQTLIFGFVKAALRRLPRFMISRSLLITTSISLSAGANSASLPNGFVREKQIYRRDSGGVKVEITHPPYFDFHNVNNNDIGAINHYDILGKVIYFDHKSEAADTIYVECFKNDTSSLVIGDSFVGNDDEVEILKDMTKYIYYKDYEEDMKKAAASKQDAADGIASVKSDYMRQQQTHVEEA